MKEDEWRVEKKTKKVFWQNAFKLYFQSILLINATIYPLICFEKSKENNNNDKNTISMEWKPKQGKRGNKSGRGEAENDNNLRRGVEVKNFQTLFFAAGSINNYFPITQPLPYLHHITQHSLVLEEVEKVKKTEGVTEMLNKQHTFPLATCVDPNLLSSSLTHTILSHHSLSHTSLWACIALPLLQSDMQLNISIELNWKNSLQFQWSTQGMPAPMTYSGGVGGGWYTNASNGIWIVDYGMFCRVHYITK